MLQLRETPQRPAEYDGAVCLFGVAEGAEEARIREALGKHGEIKSVDLTGDLRRTQGLVVVIFSTHKSALIARRAGPVTHLFSGIDTLYNERSYDGRKSKGATLYRQEKGEVPEDDEGRGWCTFESSVSSEIAASPVSI